MHLILPAHLTGANRIRRRHDILLDRPLHDPFMVSGLVLKTQPGRHRLEPIWPRAGEWSDEDRDSQHDQQAVAQ